jgi:DNA-binding beta-propeller fold protein YncE
MPLVSASVAFGLLAFTWSTHAAAPALKAGTPIPIAGAHGGFDFIRVDASAHRLLLAQEGGNGAFGVFDLSSRTLLKRVPTGTSQDAAIDVQQDQYFVSGNDPHRMLIVDRKSLSVLGTVPVSANTDLIAYDPRTSRIYESNDTAPEVWVMDPSTRTIVTSIRYDGSGVEDLAFDPGYTRLYQAVKGTNAIAEVDPATNRVLHQWPLAPDSGPHGIAIVPESRGLLVACAGKLVLLDRSNGKVLARADIPNGVDELAYDPHTHLAYAASRLGQLGVVEVKGDRLVSRGSVPDEPGTHSVAVDPNTRTVWIGYVKDNQSYVQPFSPTE